MDQFRFASGARGLKEMIGGDKEEQDHFRVPCLMKAISDISWVSWVKPILHSRRSNVDYPCILNKLHTSFI